MNPSAEYGQDFLAAKFHIDDTHIAQASHLAYLKIQSWKFALNTPSVSARFKKEASEMLQQSFFLYVSNTHVLSMEGFNGLPLN